MKFTLAIQRAIKFSVKTHEVYQKQKRKGKDVPYITHPLSVGLILSLAGAAEDVIVAGILHDTIEDSVEEKRVDSRMITERFGARVAALVESVTESDKNQPWEKRKEEAIQHIADFSNDSLLIKSADIIANYSELLDDHRRYGDEVFSNFHAPKEKMIGNCLRAIGKILEKWPDNPLKEDLEKISADLRATVDTRCLQDVV